MESTPDRALTITHATGEGGVMQLAVSGELDAHSAPELADAFEGAIAAGATVDLDLSNVSFVDSSGLAAVLEARRRLDASGGTLRVTSASSAVARLFEMTGIGEHLTHPPES